MLLGKRLALESYTLEMEATMLVLSRRADEKIVFPSIGVTVHLLKINGQVAKLGIDAPPELRILRDELLSSVDPDTVQAENRSTAHALRNRLSRIALGLHLFRRQRDASQAESAEVTLNRVFAELESLDREAVLNPPTPPKPRRLPKALLVEDDSNERELLAGLLGMSGCECVTAADGQEALDYLATHDRPDVVLLDMHMPRCDGPTALRSMRSDARLTGLRVFGVSGSSPRELGIITGPGGVDAWFAKPLNPRKLCDAVMRSVQAASI